jgi:LmbE family N-acetylglucosaminyl deacetylase
VFAHPDDEGVVGPLLAKYAREGARVQLAIATDGRYGVREFAGIPAGEALVKARADEARCAAEKLGIEPPLLLGFPDGLAKAEGSSAGTIGVLGSLVEEIRNVFTAARAEVVVTWGPDGLTGHPDHRLVSAVVTQVFQEERPGWPRNLYYTAMPREKAPGMPTVPGLTAPPLTAERYLTVRVPYEERDAQRARESFACHRSQFTPAEQAGLFGLLRHFHPGVVALRPYASESSGDLLPGR